MVDSDYRFLTLCHTIVRFSRTDLLCSFIYNDIWTSLIIPNFPYDSINTTFVTIYALFVLSSLHAFLVVYAHTTLRPTSMFLYQL